MTLLGRHDGCALDSAEFAYFDTDPRRLGIPCIVVASGVSLMKTERGGTR